MDGSTPGDLPIAERVSVSILVILLALVLATSVPAAEVTAARLDGTKVAGELQSWEGPALVVATKDGPMKLTASELLSLRWSPAPPAKAADSQLLPMVELVDGTLLPIDDFGRNGTAATLTLRCPLPTDSKTIAVPTKSVAAVRLQPLESTAAEQWDEIREQQFPGDVLVVLKRDGQSIDYLEGTLGDVSAERVEFKIEDESTGVNRAKVAGLICYRRENDSNIEPQCIVHGRDGLRASAAAVSLHDGVLQLETPSGAKIAWPLSDVHFADFSAGKLVFISDLEPASEVWTPLVGLPAGVALANNYGRVRRDASAFAGPLSLRLPNAESFGPTARPQTFGKGLAIRSRTELDYRLPRGFRRLLAVAGIDPATSDAGHVRLSILGDDRPLLETDVAGSDAPQPIELDIAGVKRLKIIVDYGQNLDTGDWLNLCDLRVVK
jgi:hypothetical protein